MLPAEKQETAPANPATPSAGGFGRVLNSIQGLQQRLDDFSVEDASRAQANAENLIRELSLMHLKLSRLAIMGQGLTNARRRLGEIADENFDSADPDSLEKYPTLHALLKASNLIEFIRTRAQSFAHYIDEWIAARESVAAVTVTADLQRIKALPSPLLQLEASPTAEASIVTIGSRVPTETEALDDMAPKIEQAEPVPSPMAEASQLQIPESENSDQDSPTGGLAELLQEATDKEKNSIAANSDFNQRLLTDLINTYGDFTGSPNFPAPRKAPKPAKPKAAEQKKATGPMALQAATIPSASHAAAPVKVPTPGDVSSKIAKTEIAPSSDSRDPQAVAENIASFARQGEIDRQLKSIIKDYGEYDLYKHHSPLNLKVVGIITVALLGLVLGLFLLFKSRTPVSHPNDSAMQSELKPSSGLQPNKVERPSNAVTNTKQRK
jgi:hypothetical protein